MSLSQLLPQSATSVTAKIDASRNENHAAQLRRHSSRTTAKAPIKILR
jgi:hypothetical protein